MANKLSISAAKLQSANQTVIVVKKALEAHIRAKRLASCPPAELQAAIETSKSIKKALYEHICEKHAECRTDTLKAKIERMVKDAEKCKAEDDAQDARVSVKDALESYCFDIHQILEDENVSNEIHLRFGIPFFDFRKFFLLRYNTGV